MPLRNNAAEFSGGKNSGTERVPAKNGAFISPHAADLLPSSRFPFFSHQTRPIFWNSNSGPHSPQTSHVIFLNLKLLYTVLQRKRRWDETAFGVKTMASHTCNRTDHSVFYDTLCSPLFHTKRRFISPPSLCTHLIWRPPLVLFFPLPTTTKEGRWGERAFAWNRGVPMAIRTWHKTLIGGWNGLSSLPSFHAKRCITSLPILCNFVFWFLFRKLAWKWPPIAGIAILPQPRTQWTRIHRR